MAPIERDGPHYDQRTLVDPVKWHAKVERLEADLRAMTKSRDNWQRKYVEARGAVNLIREARDWIDVADVRTRPVSLLARMDEALSGHPGGSGDR